MVPRYERKSSRRRASTSASEHTRAFVFYPSSVSSRAVVVAYKHGREAAKTARRGIGHGYKMTKPNTWKNVSAASRDDASACAPGARGRGIPTG
jgi:hypothetical protein